MPPNHKAPLLCNKIVLGVSGSIGATAVPQFLVPLRLGLVAEVRVLLTPSASQFVTPLSLAIYSGNPVVTGPCLDEEQAAELLEGADLCLIMPASANTLAAISIGVAETAVAQIALLAQCPVVVVPSMNDAIWRHKAVQQAISTLRGRGVHIIDPVAGFEASGMKPGFGAMPAAEIVIGRLGAILAADKAPTLL